MNIKHKLYSLPYPIKPSFFLRFSPYLSIIDVHYFQYIFCAFVIIALVLGNISKLSQVIIYKPTSLINMRDKNNHLLYFNLILMNFFFFDYMLSFIIINNIM